MTDEEDCPAPIVVGGPRAVFDTAMIAETLAAFRGGPDIKTIFPATQCDDPAGIPLDGTPVKVPDAGVDMGSPEGDRTVVQLRDAQNLGAKLCAPLEASSDLINKGAIRARNGDSQRAIHKVLEHVIAARLGYGCYDMSMNPCRRHFVATIASAHETPSANPSDRVFLEGLQSLGLSVEHERHLQKRWTENKHVRAMYDEGEQVYMVVSLYGSNGKPGAFKKFTPMDTVQRIRQKERQFADLYGAGSATLAGSGYDYRKELQKMANEREFYEEAMGEPHRGPKPQPVFPKMLMIPLETVEEALSALVGCKAVMGSTGNIQAAMDKLEKVRTDMGMPRMYPEVFATDPLLAVNTDEFRQTVRDMVKNRHLGPLMTLPFPVVFEGPYDGMPFHERKTDVPAILEAPEHGGS